MVHDRALCYCPQSHYYTFKNSFGYAARFVEVRKKDSSPLMQGSKHTDVTHLAVICASIGDKASQMTPYQQKMIYAHCIDTISRATSSMPYLHEKLKVNAKTMAHEFSLFTLAISLQKLFLQNLIFRFMKIWSLVVLSYSCKKASQSIGVSVTQ